MADSSHTLDAIARTLRRETSASRVTIRTQGAGEYGVAVESLADGVDSVIGTTVTPAHAEVLKELRAARLIIQSDVSSAEISVAPEVRTRYSVVAQIVAPVLVAGALTAIVSVHDVQSQRDWTASEIDAVVRASEQVAAVLAS